MEILSLLTGFSREININENVLDREIPPFPLIARPSPAAHRIITLSIWILHLKITHEKKKRNFPGHKIKLEKAINVTEKI